MNAPSSRRRDPRVAVSLPAQLGARQPHAATLIDLSASGCLVRGTHRLAAGQVLDLTFELDGRAVRGKVRVADVSVDGDAAGATEYLVGLEFLGLPPEETRHVAAWVVAHRPPAGRGSGRA